MRSVITAAVIALATLVAVPAFADAGDGKGDGKGKHSFPMPAATFKQKVDARMAKARTRMEERASKLSADEAKALRAKFDASAAKVNAEVAKAVADGTVTKDEAKAVREARPHHGKHAHKGKGRKGERKQPSK